MTPAAEPTRRAWLALAGALAFLSLFILGSRGLNEPDESRYAVIALEMLRTGDWWEPRMSGYGHYDKPPLTYWAVALGFRAFGVHEWSARLPSLLGAWGALAGLGWAALRLRGAWTAWWAVLICGTSAQFWTFGRILSPDMLLTGWCALGIGAWAEARQHAGGKNWGWWALSLLFWTLAWWTKGTPALVPLLGLVVGVFASGDRAGRRALRPWLLLPATIALGSPWFVSMMHTYPELKGFFFGRELAGRLAGSVDGRGGAWWYYFPVSLWAWLPWWPLAAWVAWRTRARQLGVEGWIVLTGFVILSLTASKLASYTLTLAPWAALLMARTMAGAGVSPEGNPRPGWLAPAGAFALVACAAMASLPPRYETRLGMNTSLREVSRFLRQQGATRVDTDRYWPGLEFYLGAEVVHYAIKIDSDEPGATPSPPTGKIERYHERYSDPGAPPNRFIEPDRWPALPPDAVAPRTAGDWWFVRFYKRPRRIFDDTLRADDPARRPVKVRRIGDFDVYRMPPGGL